MLVTTNQSHIHVIRNSGLWDEVAELEVKDRQRDGENDDTSMLSAGGHFSAPTVERGNSLGIAVD